MVSVATKKEYITYALSEGKTKQATEREGCPNEHEQNVLARIRTRRKQGMSHRHIAAELDAAGTQEKKRRPMRCNDCLQASKTRCSVTEVVPRLPQGDTPDVS